MIGVSSDDAFYSFYSVYVLLLHIIKQMNIQHNNLNEKKRNYTNKIPMRSCTRVSDERRFNNTFQVLMLFLSIDAVHSFVDTIANSPSN